MKHCGTQIIETGRLILRPFAMEDAPAMYRNWASDPEVTKYLTWPAHANAELTGMLLKNVYQIALNFGFDYESEEET